jgi:hypothetical protein
MHLKFSGKTRKSRLVLSFSIIVIIEVHDISVYPIMDDQSSYKRFAQEIDCRSVSDQAGPSRVSLCGSL